MTSDTEREALRSMIGSTSAVDAMIAARKRAVTRYTIAPGENDERVDRLTLEDMLIDALIVMLEIE